MTPERYIWRGMIDRCHNPENPAYVAYGARGVQVCQQWRDSFQAFFDHIGRRPSNDPYSGEPFFLDRIDSSGNYEPGNVRWATFYQHLKNRRPRRDYPVRMIYRVLVFWLMLQGTIISPSFPRGVMPRMGPRRKRKRSVT